MGGRPPGGPSACPAPSSGTWGRLKFPLEAGQVARTRGCDALRLALTACLLCTGRDRLVLSGFFCPIVQMRKRRLREGK